LNEEMLVIADAENPVAIAGVIGGELTSVIENTKNIFLEAACFDPISIRKTSKEFAISTDSSHRFIRGIDIENVPNVALIASEMIREICGGKITDGVVDICSDSIKIREIMIEVKKVNKILNTNIASEEIVDILKRLGLNCKITNNNDFLNVIVPSHRNDVNLDIDLIEEIARIYGYEKIKTSDEIKFRINITENKSERVINIIKNISVAMGFYETLSYNFVSKKDLANLKINEVSRELANPISHEEPYLATTLIHGLIKNAIRNFNRGKNDIRFFEFGKVFGDKEKMFFSGCASGNSEAWWKSKSNTIDFYFIKGFIENILVEIGVKYWEYLKSDSEILSSEQSAKIKISGKNVGNIGLLNSRVMEGYDIKNKDIFVFELDLDIIIGLANFDKKYKEIPKYPLIERDISIVVPQKYSAEEICRNISKIGGNFLTDVFASDLYTGKQITEGFKSLTFSMKFQSKDRTLKDEEVESTIKKIINQIERDFQSKLR